MIINNKWSAFELARRGSAHFQFIRSKANEVPRTNSIKAFLSLQYGQFCGFTEAYFTTFGFTVLLCIYRTTNI